MTMLAHAHSLVYLQRLSSEQLEARRCLSEVPFAAHEINVTEIDRPTSVFAADLDGDGDADILSSHFNSGSDASIVWYENVDGQGSFSPPQVITKKAGLAYSVHPADVDGDGDMDVLSASSREDKIAWYENVDGQGTFGEQQIISTDVIGARSVYTADFDGDGDVDVLSASASVDNSKIAWYENTDGRGNFGQQQLISTVAEGANSVHAADVDRDGDMDVLTASSSAGVAWYENIDGDGSFGKQQVIHENSAASVLASDLDGDGDTDALWATYGEIAWNENHSNGSSFSGKQLITNELGSVLSALATWDVDGDGDKDVLSAGADGKIAWYENTDGVGNFGQQRVITNPRFATGGVRSASAADVDGDGDVDFISASRGEIVWNENEDGKGSFGIPKIVSTSANWSARSLDSADMDGDGDLDFVLASAYWDVDIWVAERLTWYENADGKGTFGQQKFIFGTPTIGPVNAVVAADIDGDSDLDVLMPSLFGVGWNENTEGKGSFGQQQAITNDSRSIARTANVADLDGDGDLDVLVAFYVDGKVAWYENTDGQGRFAAQRVIAIQAGRANTVHATDVDGDGDLDVLSASDEVVWYENADGRGAFGPAQVIGAQTSGTSLAYVTDVDGDGDTDVLSASSLRNPETQGLVGHVAWYENTDGQGTFGPQRVVSSAQPATSILANDVDGDGDSDILSVLIDFGDQHAGYKIVWYENTDGRGSFGPSQVINTAKFGGPSTFGGDRATSLVAADFDGDGDVDVLSAFDDSIIWHENLSPQFAAGDANHDFQFNQRDVVQVLQAGKYLTGRAATFEEGDWNNDGVFDQKDIVRALQEGRYLPTEMNHDVVVDDVFAAIRE